MAEKKTITSEQVQELFTFVERKWVRYYDVQVELVDHLACSIEELWETEPDLPFEQALQRVYKRFGITGFSKVLQEKRKAIEKQTWRWIGEYMLEWVKLPKVFLTVALLFSMTQLLLLVPNSAFVMQLILLGVLVLSFAIFLYNQYGRKLHKKSKKLLFVEASSSAYGAIGGLAGLFFQLPELLLDNTRTMSLSHTIGAVLLLFVLMLFSYFTYVKLPRKIQAHIQKHFPKFA